MSTARKPRKDTLARIGERAVSDNPVERRWAANHKHCPGLVLRRLIHDADIMVQWDAARNPNLPQETIRKVLSRVTNLGSTVLHGVTQNPALTEEMIQDVLDSDKGPRLGTTWHTEGIYKHPNCPASEQKKAAWSQNAHTRGTVACNPNLPVPVQTLLARDPNISVRTHLAKNPNLDQAAVDLLAQDRAASVRIVLLDMGHRSEALIRSLRSATSSSAKAALIRHGLADETVIREAAGSRHVVARRAAGKATTDAETLSVLALDDDVPTRYQAVRNEACPDEAKVFAALTGKTIPEWYQSRRR